VRRRAAALLALVLAAAPARAPAREIEGVIFADRVELRGAPLLLSEVGLLRTRILVKAYVAALYLRPEDSPARALEDVPKRLEIEYFWGIGAADFARATEQGIARNVEAALLTRLRPYIERLNALYQDVEPGDRYALSYAPGVGTELALNGEVKGVIEGADLAAALFAIWLGEDPIDASLRAQLLGL
jgi:hypothetical protein